MEASFTVVDQHTPRLPERKRENHQSSIRVGVPTASLFCQEKMQGERFVTRSG